MEEMKKITMEEAITSPELMLGEVYMLVRIGGETTVNELSLAEAFFIVEEKREIEEDEEEDDQDRRIRELREKAERLKKRLEDFEIRDNVMMETAAMIDETIKQQIVEPDNFPEFDEELAEEVTKEPEPVPEEPKKETKKKTAEKKETKSKYDIPKIQALLNAGWTNKQLAVEFGTTPDNISKNLYAWRKAGKIK